MLDKTKYLKNEDIKGEKVYLVQEDKTLTLLNTREAIDLSNEKLLDLVKISEKENIPICKIMDLDSFLYKREKSKKKPIRQKTKTIKFSVNTDIADYNRKINQIIKFINKYNSVEVVINRKKLRKRFHLITETQDRIAKEMEEKMNNQLNCVRRDNSLLFSKKKC